MSSDDVLSDTKVETVSGNNSFGAADIQHRPRVSGVNLPLKWNSRSAGEVPVDSFKTDDTSVDLSDRLHAAFKTTPDDTGFGKTLRHMSGRAFRRNHLGAHKRDWQRLTAVFLGLLSAMMTYTIYNVACTSESYRAIFLVFVSVEIIETFWLLVIIKTSLAVKLFCFCSLALILINFTLLLAIVNFVQPANAMSASSDGWFQIQTLGLRCESDSRSVIIYYLLAAVFILEGILMICDITWGYLFYTVGLYYHEKSNLSLKAWQLMTIRSCQILTPVTVAFSEERVITTDKRRRFKLVNGIHVEYRVVWLVERFWTAVRRILLCQRRRKHGQPIDLFSSYGSRSRGSYVTFTGMVNDQGRPNGFGYWKGDPFVGECLIGFWSDGIPAGPYKSREITGSGLMCISLGWIRYEKEEQPLKFGKGHLECSVSGQFFKMFPEARLIDAPIKANWTSKGLLHDAKKRLEAMYKVTKNAVVLSNVLPKRNRPTRHRSFQPRTVQEDEGVPARSMNDRSASVQVAVDACEASDTVGDPLNSPFNSPSQSSEFESHHAATQKCDDRSATNPAWLNYNSESMRWILNELHPHTPNFGIQPKSEIVISVDPERGLDIMGYVPLQSINKHQYIDARPVWHEPLVEETGTNNNGSACCDGSPCCDQQNETAVLSVRVQEEPIVRLGSDGNPNGSELFVPELCIDGWMPMENVGAAEVLFYVHGYNNSLVESMKMLGQMAAFGNFPSHLKIVVFSWPAGRGLFSFNVAKTVAESPAAHEALFDAFRCLRANGIKQIHVLCHSMGCRLFLRSFRQSEVDRGLFSVIRKTKESDQEIWCSEQADGDSMELLTCTFLNPEYALDDFIEIDYEILRRRCGNITIYADGNDQALWWAEFFSRKESLGRSVFGMRLDRCTSSRGSLFPNPTPHRPSLEDLSAGGGSGSAAERVVEQVAGSDALGLKVIENRRRLQYLHTLSFFQLENSEKDANSTEQQPHRTARLNRTALEWRIYRRHNRRHGSGEWLDVDIIDTTFMDQNVHGLRHSFWNLNREVIEDLREILVTRKRARQRGGRLDRREGNVWVFRVAPSFLTSIFA